eukprot:scaffold563386_cov43-Prasinocladus_malaysianus.AAC.1
MAERNKSFGPRARQALDTIARSRAAALSPGEFFDGTTRLALYLEAAAAFRSCEACASLSEAFTPPCS